MFTPNTVFVHCRQEAGGEALSTVLGGGSPMALLPLWAALDGLACWGPGPLRVLTFCM